MATHQPDVSVCFGEPPERSPRQPNHMEADLEDGRGVPGRTEPLGARDAEALDSRAARRRSARVAGMDARTGITASSARRWVEAPPIGSIVELGSLSGGPDDADTPGDRVRDYRVPTGKIHGLLTRIGRWAPADGSAPRSRAGR